jgi:type IV pilus assembly protein PilA
MDGAVLIASDTPAHGGPVGSTGPNAPWPAPSGVGAVISSAEDKRNQRKLILILVIVAVVLISIPAILIIAAVTIPALLSSRERAREFTAIQNVRVINTAELQYDATYPDKGFACSLAALSGDPKSGPATPEAAQILSADFSSGIKLGYVFTIGNCTRAEDKEAGPITGYRVTAVPQTVGKTGKRGFCSDQSGLIKADPTGGTNCTQPVE